MSLSLSLIKYKMTNEGKYIEEGLRVIKHCFLSEKTKDRILTKISFAELTLFEDENSTEFSTLDCILDQNLNDVITLISNMFLDLFLEEKNTLVTKLEQNLHETIIKFGEISNIYTLITLKKNEYADDKSVIVKIG